MVVNALHGFLDRYLTRTLTCTGRFIIVLFFYCRTGNARERQTGKSKVSRPLQIDSTSGPKELDDCRLSEFFDELNKRL